MDNFSHLVTFISVLIGLAITNLLHSLHLLLKARKHIKWSWIPLFWTFIGFESLIIMWFNLENELNTSIAKNAVGFLLILLPTVCHILFVIAILPDKQPKKHFDLQAWYFSQSGYLFSIGSVFLILLLIVRLVTGNFDVYSLISNIIIIPIALLLVKSKNYKIHAFFTGLTFILLHIGILGQFIGKG